MGARVDVYDRAGASVFEGATPCSLVVDHGASFFVPAEYRVVVSPADGAPRETLVGASVNPWYAENTLIPGGLVGALLVDPPTGAVYRMETQEVRLEFDALK